MSDSQRLTDLFIQDPNDASMSCLIEYFERNISTDEGLVYLIKGLANSGDKLEGLGKKTADIASTGGPFSLSTLLCPLYLRSLEYIVPSLAVPGRPAGGIDVLSQIPGYNVYLTLSGVEKVLERCGYARFITSSNFTPLDGILFSYRKRTGKVGIPDLVIASLLAKKIAAGVSLIGLDIRVAMYGNFGSNMHEASCNAKRFCEIASCLGIKAVCFLSNATIPYQPYLGRGEALVAMWNVINSTDNSWLQKHNDFCYAMTQRLAFNLSGKQVSRPKANTIIKVLSDNLEAQGSSLDALMHKVFLIESSHIYEITAKEEGFLHIDTNALRYAIIAFQSKYIVNQALFNDPCGLILRKDQGDFVCQGDLLATVRCSQDFFIDFNQLIHIGLFTKPYPPSNIGFTEVLYD